MRDIKGLFYIFFIKFFYKTISCATILTHDWNY
jgi:hypothetical protein